MINLRPHLLIYKTFHTREVVKKRAHRESIALRLDHSSPFFDSMLISYAHYITSAHRSYLYPLVISSWPRYKEERSAKSFLDCTVSRMRVSVKTLRESDNAIKTEAEYTV